MATSTTHQAEWAGTLMVGNNPRRPPKARLAADGASNTARDMLHITPEAVKALEVCGRQGSANNSTVPSTCLDNVDPRTGPESEVGPSRPLCYDSRRMAFPREREMIDHSGWGLHVRPPGGLRSTSALSEGVPAAPEAHIRRGTISTACATYAAATAGTSAASLRCECQLAWIDKGTTETINACHGAPC